MRIRHLFHLLILALVLPATVAARYTPQDTLAALEDATPTTACVIRREIGNAIWRGGILYEALDPNIPGALQEEGPLQFLPRGGLKQHYLGWVQPWLDVHFPGEQADTRNPYTNVLYGNWALGSGGLRGNWPTAWGCP